MALRVELGLISPDAGQYAGRGQASRDIAGIVSSARDIESLGFDRLSCSESGHDPYLPLMLAAEHTRHIGLGTNVATSFPRSPMVTAQAAWDLQHLSKGRFTLGLGTQVKRHNERRYGIPWNAAPVPRMRDYLLCLRAIFHSFQHPDTPRYFEGEHYRFTMLPPFFNPGPIAFPHIPIQAAAANPHMSRLAGELCDGLRLHPIATFRYAREVILPAVAEGAARAGRPLSGFDLVGAPFMATGRDPADLAGSKEELRQQIAFYGATRAFHPVFVHHGWADTANELHRLSLAGRWQDMGGLITDDMLDEWAITATHDELPDAILAKADGLFGTVVLGLPGRARNDRDMVRTLVRRLQQGATAPFSNLNS